MSDTDLVRELLAMAQDGGVLITPGPGGIVARQSTWVPVGEFWWWDEAAMREHIEDLTPEEREQWAQATAANG